jgi:hypothetical protein
MNATINAALRVMAMVGTVLIAPCTPPPPPVVTVYAEIDVKGQQQSNWCYAATAEMVRDYFVGDDRAPDNDQCSAASMEWFANTTDCCPAGSSTDIDCSRRGGSIGGVLRSLWGIPSKPAASSDFAVLSFEQIKNQLSMVLTTGKRSPIVATWFIEDGSNCPMTKHNVVVIGTTEVGSVPHVDRYVVLNNPLPEGVGERWVYTAAGFEQDAAHRRQLPVACNQPTSDYYDIGR